MEAWETPQPKGIEPRGISTTADQYLTGNQVYHQTDSRHAASADHEGYIR